MAFTPGTSVGPYQIIEQLGQGGMATVFKAYHPALDRDVAIKVLHPAFKNDPQFFARFQREARIVARLEHPNIVPVYDFNEFEGEPYLVMRYVQGETLKVTLKNAPLSPRDVRKVMRPVCDALAYAHKQGILHRDIKPSNIIISDDGHVFLTDFGLARMAELGESTLSQDMMVGTPQYISPEQAQGQSNLDGRTDIYALGVVLFEMLTGNVPYSADTPFAVIHDHIYKPLPIPSSINPDINEQLEKVVLHALAKDPADRFATMGDFWQALDTALIAAEGSIPTELHPAQATLPQGKTDVQPKKKFYKRKSFIIGALIGTFLLCALLAILSSQNENNAPPADIPAAIDQPAADNPPIDAPRSGTSDKLPPNQAEEDVQKLVSQGIELMKQDQVDAAAEKFNRAIDLAPQYLLPYFYLANLQLAAGNQEGAVSTMQAAIENNAARPEAYTMIGYVLSREGVLPEAHDMYNTAIDLDPEYAPAYAGLARVNMLEDDMAAAEENIQHAMELDSNNPSVQIVDAEMMFKMGDRREALQRLRDMANNPDMKNPVLRDELRFVFDFLGERMPNSLR